MTPRIPRDTSRPRLDRRSIPKPMREFFESLIGEALTPDECGDAICVSERTWKKLETQTSAVHDGQIKLFCYAMGLRALETAEEKGELEKKLGGPLTIKNVFDYVDRLFEQFDPVEAAFEETSR